VSEPFLCAFIDNDRGVFSEAAFAAATLATAANIAAAHTMEAEAVVVVEVVEDANMLGLCEVYPTCELKYRVV
jgi:hypothetical protein